MQLLVIVLSLVFLALVIGGITLAINYAVNQLTNHPNTVVTEATGNIMLRALKITKKALLVTLALASIYSGYSAYKATADMLSPDVIEVAATPPAIEQPVIPNVQQGQLQLVQYTDRELFTQCMKMVPAKNLTADTIKACGDASQVLMRESAP